VKTNIEITRDLIDDMSKAGLDVHQIKRNLKNTVQRITKRPAKVKVVRRQKLRRRRYSDIRV
jgi:hypothetical protein